MSAIDKDLDLAVQGNPSGPGSEIPSPTVGYIVRARRNGGQGGPGRVRRSGAGDHTQATRNPITRI